MQYNRTQTAEKRIRLRCFVFWGSLEAGIYTALAFALALTAIIAPAGTGRVLWEGLWTWQSSDTVLQTIDRMLLVPMLVEILHTVRISIRSHVLVTEPFLIVGLIATIRRILVISLEMCSLTKESSWSDQCESTFRSSMLELGLFGYLVFVSVFSFMLSHFYSPW